MKRRIGIMLLALTVMFSACKNEESENVLETAATPVVTVEKSQTIKYRPEHVYSGVAFAKQEANLGTPLPGRVEEIFCKVGDHVNEGDLLVKMSQSLLEQTDAELEAVRKDYDRVSRLKEKGSLTQQDFDHVEAKLKATEAKNDMILGFTEIHAPFSGTVAEFIVKKGEVYAIAPGLEMGYSMTSGIVRLMQINKLKVSIESSEVDYPKIRKGGKAKVSFDAYPDTVFDAKIIEKGEYFSVMSHTANVDVEIDNSSRLIKPGMFARVYIEMPEQEYVFVPQEAIYRLSGTNDEYVFVLKDNKVKRVPITRGEIRGSLVAVTGLESNLDVLVSGLQKVSDGCEVIVGKKEGRN